MYLGCLIVVSVGGRGRVRATLGTTKGKVPSTEPGYAWDSHKMEAYLVL